MSAFILFWSLSSISFASYQSNTHDDQFAQMLSYKIEGIISERGESSRALIITTLRRFAEKFTNQDPRFAYIVLATSTILEENTWNNSEINAVTTGFVAKNEVNEKNSSLWITNVWQSENNLNQVMLDISSNPNTIFDTEIFPTIDHWKIAATANCVVYGSSPFSGSTMISSIVGPRGRFYAMPYDHVTVTTDTIINFTEWTTVSFTLPKLPSATYTLMCHLVVVDVVDEENSLNNLAYRSAYYYFDVEVE